MAGQRHNAAFIVGSVLGGVVGAAAALWKAPRSGPELRAMVKERIGGAGGTTVSTRVSSVVETSRAPITSTVSRGRDILNATRSSETRTAGRASGIGGKALSFVEKATAPIVGVKLGQTARPGESPAPEGVDSATRETVTRTVEPASSSRFAPLESMDTATDTGADQVVRRASPGETSDTGADQVVRRASPGETSDTGADQVVRRASAGEVSDTGAGHVPTTDELVTPIIPVEPQDPTPSSGSFTKFPDFEGDKQSR